MNIAWITQAPQEDIDDLIFADEDIYVSTR